MALTNLNVQRSEVTLTGDSDSKSLGQITGAIMRATVDDVDGAGVGDVTIEDKNGFDILQGHFKSLTADKQGTQSDFGTVVVDDELTAKLASGGAGNDFKLTVYWLE